MSSQRSSGSESWMNCAMECSSCSMHPPKLHGNPSPSLSMESAAKSFFGQIILHTITYPEQFPTESRKVAFAMKVFNAEEVAFNKFLDDFKSSFFNHNCQHRAEVALKSLRQTGTVSAYMQEFNSQAHTIGWANTTDESLPAWTEGKRPTRRVPMPQPPTPMQWTSQPSNVVHTTNSLTLSPVKPLLPLWPSRKYLSWMLQQEQEVLRPPEIFVFSPDL
ncbi:uncharacterized protein VP01_2052g1 [Puccinia sorghi]|uniref:Retrotransposon gag domain-containing protein n=1 Tax=Puccinia sorghi TaxID=27349 RepID=A0A0L6VAS0_9BASI|nr:uncharacterized protein VP01_2052g1 [Puccinia sorghi]